MERIYTEETGILDIDPETKEFVLERQDGDGSVRIFLCMDKSMIDSMKMESLVAKKVVVSGFGDFVMDSPVPSMIEVSEIDCFG